MKHLFRLLVIVFLTILTQISCRTTQETAIDPAKSNGDITVQEARMFIDAQKSNDQKGRSAADAELRNEYWGRAQKLNFATGKPAIVVPLTYDYYQQAAFFEKPNGNGRPANTEDRRIQSKLLVYKDAKGNTVADVIDIIPTDEARTKNKAVEGDKFTGYILRRPDNGKGAPTGLVYKNGKLTGSLDLVSSKKGGRSNNGCLLITIYLYRIDGCCLYLQIEEVAWCPKVDDGGGSGPGGGEPGAYVPEPIFVLDPRSGNNTYYEDGSVILNQSNLIIEENRGFTGMSAPDRFFELMAERQPKILFTVAEKELIRGNIVLFSAVSEYVLATGNKPNLWAFTIDVENATNEQILAKLASLLGEPGVPKNLTEEELRLLKYGTSEFRVNLKLYYKDAYDASIRTINRTSYKEAVEIGHSKANAFKHALLAIFHARSFGRELAEKITNAHENYTPNDPDPNKAITALPLDVQMDLWNNSEGFNIFSSNPNRTDDQFDQAVYAAATSGQLRYIYTGAGGIYLSPFYFF